jgi:hypothetical protein
MWRSHAGIVENNVDRLSACMIPSTHMHIMRALLRVTKTTRGTSSHSGIDADVLIKVTSYAATDPYCRGINAAAASHKYEDGTYRPIYGYIIFCKIKPSDFEGDLATTMHEVMHVLVRHHASWC